MLNKLLQFDPNNEQVKKENILTDIQWVQKYSKDGENAYNAKDFRKVSWLWQRFLIGVYI